MVIPFFGAGLRRFGVSALNNANVDSIGLLGRLQLINIKTDNVSFMWKFAQIAIFGMQWNL